MNTDDFIAMHKATEGVIDELAAINLDIEDRTVQAAVGALLSAVTTLATVQRDILAEVLA